MFDSNLKPFYLWTGGNSFKHKRVQYQYFVFNLKILILFQNCYSCIIVYVCYVYTLWRRVSNLIHKLQLKSIVAFIPYTCMHYLRVQCVYFVLTQFIVLYCPCMCVLECMFIFNSMWYYVKCVCLLYILSFQLCLPILLLYHVPIFPYLRCFSEKPNKNTQKLNQPIKVTIIIYTVCPFTTNDNTKSKIQNVKFPKIRA